jgi:hypothetical protein
MVWQEFNIDAYVHMTPYGEKHQLMRGIPSTGTSYRMRMERWRGIWQLEEESVDSAWIGALGVSYQRISRCLWPSVSVPLLLGLGRML